MATPHFITITEIRCFSTHDLLGDQLVGVMGPVTLELGSFQKTGDAGPIVATVSIGHIIPAGELFLTITERNLIVANTDLGIIDLTEHMNQRRVALISRDPALYEIVFEVESVADFQPER